MKKNKKNMTKRQALFIKYLATRMRWVNGSKGQTIRNIAMYFYSRYPYYYGEDSVIKEVNQNKKWWDQDFFTSQIDGCILMDKAAYTLGDFSNCKNTNWNQARRTWQSDESFYKYLPKELHKKYPKIKKPISIKLKDLLSKFKKSKPVKWKLYKGPNEKE